MPQFLLPEDSIRGGRFTLSGPETHHAVKVRRLRPGQEIALFDGKGKAFTGMIEEIGKDGTISGRIVSEKTARGVGLHLYAAILKGPRWDWLVEKTSELGVSALTPIVTERTIVSWGDAKKSEEKRLRSERIALAAAKQCERLDLPAIESVLHFDQALEKACASGGPVFVAWEKAPQSSSLLTAIKESASAGRGADSLVHIFTGPEGGLTDEEAALAEKKGARLVSLGPIVVRAETAAIAACALIQNVRV